MPSAEPRGPSIARDQMAAEKHFDILAVPAGRGLPLAA
jgi:hypothetical protein